MEKYIPLDAVVAEIERRYEINLIGAHSAFRNGKIEALRQVKDFLYTLEVKEVHLDCNITGIKSKHAEGQLKECIGRITEESLAKARKQLKKEPVSEELDVIAREYAGIPCDAPKDLTYCVHDKKAKYDAVLFGANWKEQQFEKNRLAHCEAQTEEQAQIESDFVTQHIKENNRTPTFIDAIKYGMECNKQQMMKEAVEGKIVSVSTRLGQLFKAESELMTDNKFKWGDKVKVIVIKEEKL